MTTSPNPTITSAQIRAETHRASSTQIHINRPPHTKSKNDEIQKKKKAVKTKRDTAATTQDGNKDT
jgi:hypothetical protein